LVGYTASGGLLVQMLLFQEIELRKFDYIIIDEVSVAIQVVRLGDTCDRLPYPLVLTRKEYYRALSMPQSPSDSPFVNGIGLSVGLSVANQHCSGKLIVPGNV